MSERTRAERPWIGEKKWARALKGARDVSWPSGEVAVAAEKMRDSRQPSI